ncbi:MAG: alpha/beta hydrolase [Bradymonadales bacterium]|nr:alpha/beta hydrolase [Bradymonadales bacterium]
MSPDDRDPGRVAEIETAHQPTPRTMQTRRGPLEYVDLGTGPAVLALHGAMGGFDQSLLLTRTIGPPDYRYLAVSRPGYLGTPLSLGKSPEEQADRCAELLDSLGISQAAVMAVSGGGPAAVHFALRHPDRCWGLVLVSTCATTVEDRPPLSFYLLKILARIPWFTRAMRQKVERDIDGAAKASIPDDEMRARTLADPETGPLFVALQRSTADRVAQRLPGTYNDVAVTRTHEYPLENIAVPTLVVHGTADRMLPFDRHGKAMAKRIPGAELVLAQGGDHVAIYTHRRQVLPAVEQFLKQHQPTHPGQTTA